MNIPELRRKAQRGDAVAQTILGICYLDGSDVEADYGEAFRLLTSASEKRVPRAMTNLARMYAKGLGTAKNIVEAVRLYESAAEAGEFLAQVQLGRIYSRGAGVPTDLEAAMRWYSAAADQEGSVDDCLEIREAKSYARKSS
jgi:TPR repeat protein